mmetsp:Transcript_2760/g.7134  ORF Transcript_2760/g.7134 Transcript_2760/m.7134 type:complete len:278 (-) Transcript_2760:96-929(-)
MPHFAGRESCTNAWIDSSREKLAPPSRSLAMRLSSLSTVASWEFMWRGMVDGSPASIVAGAGVCVGVSPLEKLACLEKLPFGLKASLGQAVDAWVSSNMPRTQAVDARVSSDMPRTKSSELSRKSRCHDSASESLSREGSGDGAQARAGAGVSATLFSGCCCCFCGCCCLIVACVIMKLQAAAAGPAVVGSAVVAGPHAGHVAAPGAVEIVSPCAKTGEVVNATVVGAAGGAVVGAAVAGAASSHAQATSQEEDNPQMIEDNPMMENNAITGKEMGF